MPASDLQVSSRARCLQAKLWPLQAHPIRMSTCPDPPIIQLALAAQPAQMLCLSGSIANIWQLGTAVLRTQQVSLML